MTSTTKDPQQRRYCDQDDHGMGTDAEADRYCYEHHDVRMPQVTSTKRTVHANVRFYGAEIDIYDQDYPQDKQTFIVHTVHSTTGDLWAQNDYDEQIHILADEIPSDIRLAN